MSWRFDGGRLSGDAELKDAEPLQLDVLAGALELLPDVLCQAVRRVAFVSNPSASGTNAWTVRNDRQDLVYINAASPSAWTKQFLEVSDVAKYQAMQVFVHEATHAAVRMLQSQQKASPLGALQERPDENLWPAGARTVARKAIDQMRLDGGILREWQRLHESFVARGFAAPYYGSGWQGRAAADVAADGFASAYGGENPMEDIAEIVSWAIVRRIIPTPQNSEGDAACAAMSRARDRGVPTRLAAVYTKVGFAQSLGFIETSAFEDCIGSLEIRGAGEQGFQTMIDNEVPRSYAGNVRAAIRRVDDAYFFELKADGVVNTSAETLPATVRLTLDVTPGGFFETPIDRVSFPRGVYPVGSRHKSRSSFVILHSGTEDLVMEVSQGLALVSRASCELIEGSVSIQRYFNFAGGLMSSIAGDEPVGVPTNFNFRFRPNCK